MDILIRDVPEEIVQRIDELARKANQTRQGYLLGRINDLAKGDWQPVRHGQGFKCFTPTGGEATIRMYSESVGGGADRLTQAQMDAYQRAKLLADPRNGGRWAEAREVLEKAGFEVFNT